MLRTSKSLFPRWNRWPHGKGTGFSAIQPGNEGLWDQANRSSKPRDKEEFEYGRGGRIPGHMFSNADGKKTLSGKFSYHHIPKKIENMNEELVTEMWLSRPFMTREEAHFMETGDFVPPGKSVSSSAPGGFTEMKDQFQPGQLVEDDQGNYIARPKIKYPEKYKPKYVQEKEKLKLEADRLKYSLSMKPNVYAADLWAASFKHQIDPKVSKKELNKINLDFYQKYHDMAVPTKYPLSMPPPEDDWKNWIKIPEFKKYATREGFEKNSKKYDPTLKYRGEIMGVSNVQHGRVGNPLKESDRNVKESEGDGLKPEDYRHHPYDSKSYEDQIGNRISSKKILLEKMKKMQMKD